MSQPPSTLILIFKDIRDERDDRISVSDHDFIPYYIAQQSQIILILPFMWLLKILKIYFCICGLHSLLIFFLFFFLFSFFNSHTSVTVLKHIPIYILYSLPLSPHLVLFTGNYRFNTHQSLCHWLSSLLIVWSLFSRGFFRKSSWE